MTHPIPVFYSRMSCACMRPVVVLYLVNLLCFLAIKTLREMCKQEQNRPTSDADSFKGKVKYVD